MVEPLKRYVSICQNLDGIRPMPGLTTLIQIKSERQISTHNVIEVTNETRYVRIQVRGY